MLILERSVTKPYWTSVQDYLLRRLNSDRYREVRGYSVFNVFGGDNTTTYAVVKDNSPVAWLYLGKRPQWKAWEVKQVWVFPECRGLGLAAHLYKAAVCGDGILLASGKSQSKSSRALWKSFVERGTFNIWAQDFNNLKLTSEVYLNEDGEIEADLPIYTHAPCKHDIRLLALRKD